MSKPAPKRKPKPTTMAHDEAGWRRVEPTSEDGKIMLEALSQVISRTEADFAEEKAKNESRELKFLLRDARHEIDRLRHDNEILRAKVEVMDLFALVLTTEPARRIQGAAPDVAWALQKKIDELAAKEPKA